MDAGPVADFIKSRGKLMPGRPPWLVWPRLSGHLAGLPCSPRTEVVHTWRCLGTTTFLGCLPSSFVKSPSRPVQTRGSDVAVVVGGLGGDYADGHINLSNSAKTKLILARIPDYLLGYCQPVSITPARVLWTNSFVVLTVWYSQDDLVTSRRKPFP